MSRFRGWLNARPLWQYVLFEAVLGLAILIPVGEILYRLTHSGYERLSPVFFVIWLAFMIPVYVWQGKRRRAA
jgi:hypothetical protein